MAMDDILAYAGGIVCMDTMAHELGHNLGLEPPSLGGDSTGHIPDDGGNDWLMDAGGYAIFRSLWLTLIRTDWATTS